jgi:hypothetical protein
MDCWASRNFVSFSDGNILGREAECRSLFRRVVMVMLSASCWMGDNAGKLMKVGASISVRRQRSPWLFRCKLGLSRKMHLSSCSYLEDGLEYCKLISPSGMPPLNESSWRCPRSQRITKAKALATVLQRLIVGWFQDRTALILFYLEQCFDLLKLKIKIIWNEV